MHYPKSHSQKIKTAGASALPVLYLYSLLWVNGDLEQGPAVRGGLDRGLDRPLGSVQVYGVLSPQGSLVSYASSVFQPKRTFQ